MAELPKPKGIFSDEHLPREWAKQEIDTEVYRLPLSIVCPDMRVVSQLARSTDTTTFVLQGSDGLQVCQFGPSLRADHEEGVASYEEKYNPNKFHGASERMSYLQSQGISVPKVISNGFIKVGDETRQFLVTDFVKGVSADVFLVHHPNKRQEVYYKFGEILARLNQVPFMESDDISSKDHILQKVKHASDFLESRKILSLNQGKGLLKIVAERLSLLGEQPMTYVHLDPSPTNLHISGRQSNFNVTLMDIEAIQKGHPIIEGLGRAIQWGIYSWDYITGEQIGDIDLIVRAFLDGYSQVSTIDPKLTEYTDGIEWLVETNRIVNLPQAIMYEHKKKYLEFEQDREHSSESFDWSKETLLGLIDKWDPRCKG